jgi:hypothetical protein
MCVCVCVSARARACVHAPSGHSLSGHDSEQFSIQLPIFRVTLSTQIMKAVGSLTVETYPPNHIAPHPKGLQSESATHPEFFSNELTIKLYLICCILRSML